MPGGPGDNLLHYRLIEKLGDPNSKSPRIMDTPVDT